VLTVSTRVGEVGAVTDAGRVLANTEGRYTQVRRASVTAVVVMFPV